MLLNNKTTDGQGEGGATLPELSSNPCANYYFIRYALKMNFSAKIRISLLLHNMILAQVEKISNEV